jgi:Mn-dependent DtxR family transcriptional regulator
VRKQAIFLIKSIEVLEHANKEQTSLNLTKFCMSLGITNPLSALKELREMGIIEHNGTHNVLTQKGRMYHKLLLEIETTYPEEIIKLIRL